MGSLHEGGTVGAMLITAIERFADRPAIADNRPAGPIAISAPPREG